MGIRAKGDESKESLVEVSSEKSCTFPPSPCFSIHGNSDAGHLDSQRFSNFSQVLDPMTSPRRFSDASTYSMSFYTGDFGGGGGGGGGEDGPNNGPGEKEDFQDVKDTSPYQAVDSKGAGTHKAVGSLPYFQLYKFADRLDWLLMILGSVAAMLHGLIMPLGIFMLTRIVGALGANAFNGNEAYRQVCRIVLIMIYIGIQAIWLSLIEVSFWTIAGERQSGRIRARYLESLLRQEVAFYDTEMTTGEIVHQISSDSLLIHEAMGEKVASFLHNISTFVGGIVFMLVEVWQLGLINVVFLPVTVGVAIAYTKIYTKCVIRSAGTHLESSSVIERTISQVRTVYSYVGELKAVQALSQVLDKAVKLGRAGGLVKGVGMGISLAVSNIQWSLQFWIGALLVTGGRNIRGSDILATALTAMYTGMSLGSAIREVETFTNGKVAAYRIFKIIDRKPLIDSLDEGGIILQNLKGELELSNVHFTYPARPDVAIFKGLNLKIPAARTVALVGTSGSGKSTVIQLIERFYDPSVGVVKLDGVDIKSLQLKWLRSQMGLVGQEPVLFSTTIRQNIMHGKPTGATERDMVAAATAANAHSFIKQLPQQYDTQVGEKGAQLSGGQKQRVAIARAVLKNPAVLLLDEATSALDTESEQVVQLALDNVMHGRTTVVIAHRLSTVQHADVIAVFDGGRVAELGTHAELLRRGAAGVYFNLVNLQSTTAGTGQAARTPTGRNAPGPVSSPRSPLGRPSLGSSSALASPVTPRRSFHAHAHVSSGPLAPPRRSFHALHQAETFDWSPSGAGRNGGGRSSTPVLESVRFAASPAVSDMMSPSMTWHSAVLESPLPPPAMSLGPAADGQDDEFEPAAGAAGVAVGKQKQKQKQQQQQQQQQQQGDPEEEAKKGAVPAWDVVDLFKGEVATAAAVVVASVVAGLFTPVFAVISIKTVFYFYGRYSEQQVRDGVGRNCLVFLGLGLGSLLAHAAQHYSGCRLGAAVAKRTQEKAFAALLRNEVAWFDRAENSSAMVTSRLSTDTSVLRIALSERLVLLIQYLTSVVVAVALAFTFSWRMALVSLTLIPLAMFSGAMRHGFMSVGVSGSTKLAQEQSTQIAAESVANIRTVASLGVEPAMSAAFHAAVSTSQTRRTKVALQGGFLLGLSQFSSMCVNGLVLWYAARLMRSGAATFVSALVVFQVLSSTAYNLMETLKIAPDLARAAGAAGSALRTIHRRSAIDPTVGSDVAPDATGPAPTILLDDVTFAYPARPAQPVLRRMHLLVPAGATTALVGPSGSGKSSVLALVQRFYDPDAGRVLIDGADVRSLNPRALRRHTALVAQEPALFGGTVRDNIAYGRASGVATEAEIQAAARAANAHGFICALPDGYDTVVGERGAALSGGQRQRIAIARAVLKQPRVLLLDEATSALDAASERVVQEALDRVVAGGKGGLGGGRAMTVVVVAHRLATVQSAPHIAVVERGTVVESGTHLKLIKSRGTYAKLVHLQELTTLV